MLWRKSYQTRVERDLSCPVAEIVSLDGSPVGDQTEVWIAGFGFEATTDQGVWWRLFQSDFPDDARIIRVFICPSVGKGELETALSLVPPSQISRTYLVADPSGLWRQTIRPNSDDQGFAIIIEKGKIPLAMIGPPTEDAWDEFHNEWEIRT